MLGFAGVTSIDTRVAAVTVNVVLPVTARAGGGDGGRADTGRGRGQPFEPAALLTVATAPSDDAQVTWVVRSCVELSL